MSYEGIERRKEYKVFTYEEKMDLLQDVRDIKHILTGNGNPETGLVFLNRKNTEFRLVWERFWWLILAGFAGVPCTVIAAFLIHYVKQ